MPFKRSTNKGSNQPLSKTPLSAKSETSPRQFKSWPADAARWTLVWCHEMSQTPASKELRKVLDHQAKQRGAHLLCLKKAQQFEQWSSTNTKPYVLFTDWREAKGCVKAVTLRGQEGRPILTNVFCIDAKQQLRADRWRLKLADRKDPVYIKGLPLCVQSPVACLLQQAQEALTNKVQTQTTSPLTQQLQTGTQFQVVPQMNNNEATTKCLLTHQLEDEMQTAPRAEHPTLTENGVPLLHLFELTHPKDGVCSTQVTMDDVPTPHSCRLTPPGLPAPPGLPGPLDSPGRLRSNAEQRSQTCLNRITNKPVPMVMLACAAPLKVEFDPGDAAHSVQVWESCLCPAKIDKSLLMAIYEE